MFAFISGVVTVWGYVGMFVVYRALLRISHYITFNNNIIPKMWKLENIIPIPKPNKYINMGISYRSILLLSVINKTLEKSLLPYITNNIQQIIPPCSSKKMTPPAHTITVALDMSKAFDTVNIHKFTRKLLRTRISQTLLWNEYPTTSNDAKHTQHSENTHQYNANLKIAFLKGVASQPHFSTCTHQTYHNHQQH